MSIYSKKILNKRVSQAAALLVFCVVANSVYSEQAYITQFQRWIVLRTPNFVALATEPEEKGTEVKYIFYPGQCDSVYSSVSASHNNLSGDLKSLDRRVYRYGVKFSNSSWYWVEGTIQIDSNKNMIAFFSRLTPELVEKLRQANKVQIDSKGDYSPSPITPSSLHVNMRGFSAGFIQSKKECFLLQDDKPSTMPEVKIQSSDLYSNEYMLNK